MTPITPQPTARAISDREFVLEHTFRAPAVKVWAGYTDPMLIPLWWAPRGGSLRIESMDVRPGGEWRFVQKGDAAVVAEIAEAPAPYREIGAHLRKAAT